MPYTSPSTDVISGSTTTNLEIPIVSSPDTFKVGSLFSDPFFVPPELQLSPIYRGFLSGQYVYTVGTAPVGAVDVIIVGYR